MPIASQTIYETLFLRAILIDDDIRHALYGRRAAYSLFRALPDTGNFRYEAACVRSPGEKSIIADMASSSVMLFSNAAFIGLLHFRAASPQIYWREFTGERYAQSGYFLIDATFRNIL